MVKDDSFSQDSCCVEEEKLRPFYNIQKCNLYWIFKCKKIRILENLW